MAILDNAATILQAFADLQRESHYVAAQAVSALPATATARDISIARDMAMSNLWRQRSIPGMLFDEAIDAVTEPRVVTTTRQEIKAEVNQIIRGKSPDGVIVLHVHEKETAYAVTTITIGSSPSCHIVVTDAAPLNAVVTRRPDGTVWLMNMHPTGANLAVKPPGRIRRVITGSSTLEPDAVISVGKCEIRVIDC